MTKKINLIGKVFLFSFAIWAVYFFFLPFTPLLIGAVITQGILGKVTGKVGNVVGGDWKGINYLRGYVIPANPNTADQQTQRSRFVIMQDYVRQVLSTLVQPYWDPFAVGKSGYNAIMSEFLLNAPVSNLLTAAVKLSKGTLSPQAINVFGYTAGDGKCNPGWTLGLVGNQLGTDVPQYVIFDKSTGILYFRAGQATRADEGDEVTIPLGLTPSNLECYTFFTQGSGSSMIISDSVHKVAQVP